MHLFKVLHVVYSRLYALQLDDSSVYNRKKKKKNLSCRLEGLIWTRSNVIIKAYLCMK